MKKKNTILIVSSILAVALIIGTSITPALARPGLDTGTQENKEAEVLGDDGGCSTCGGTEQAGAVDNSNSEEDMALPGQSLPDNNDPPQDCYPCGQAIILGLSASKDDILEAITSFPNILNYYDGEAGWVWVYLDAIAEWLLTIPSSLIGTLQENFNNYEFYPAELLSEAVVDGLSAVGTFVENGFQRFLNGEIDFPVLTSMLAIPIMAGIFTIVAGYSLLMLCFGEMLGGGATGTTGSQSTATGTTATQSTASGATATQSATAGTMSL